MKSRYTSKIAQHVGTNLMGCHLSNKVVILGPGIGIAKAFPWRGSDLNDISLDHRVLVLMYAVIGRALLCCDSSIVSVWRTTIMGGTTQ